MTLKIEKSVRKGSTVLALSGRLEAEHIGELEGLFERKEDLPAVVLDLREVRLADRAAVKFLARCESVGVQLENCPAYIREWMGKEKA
jgi:anti-anti-sigma regulatory factor